MTIRFLDPRGKVATSKPEQERRLDTIEGKRVGYVFNQHTSALIFWKALEREVDRRYRPAAVQRLYKENTWAPAPAAEAARLARETDYALVGLGA